MRTTRDPGQQRLFDPFAGIISVAGRKLISDGWQGVIRHIVLHQLPAARLGDDLSEDHGRPSAELYAMCGLLLIKEFRNWTVAETHEAVLFRNDVQYALNLEPGFDISQRTIERYIARMQEDEGLAAELMATVTDTLIRQLELVVSKQRLDSTHIASDMAVFGRTRMMGITVKRFLSKVKRHHVDDFATIPEEYRQRYIVSDGSLFADVKTTEQRQKTRQQAAEDLHAVIEHFADHEVISSWASYKKLLVMFDQQCEVVEDEDDRVEVKKCPGGDVMLNTSDEDATYCGHKGPGYQAQLAETCHEDNEVELIVGSKVEPAHKADSDAVKPMLDELESQGHKPQTMLADAGYGSDDNVNESRDRDVELVSPVPGGKAYDPTEITVADFEIDEREESVTSCPAGHAPLSSVNNESSGYMTVTMSPESCRVCLLLNRCPIKLKQVPQGKKPSAKLHFRMREYRSCRRRIAEQQPEFRNLYRMRSGIESTNGALKRRIGLKRLRVRGMLAVKNAVMLKVAGWNILRASATSKFRQLVAQLMAASGLVACFQTISAILSGHQTIKTTFSSVFSRRIRSTTQKHANIELAQSL